MRLNKENFRNNTRAPVLLYAGLVLSLEGITTIRSPFYANRKSLESPNALLKRLI